LLLGPCQPAGQPLHISYSSSTAVQTARGYMWRLGLSLPIWFAYLLRC
jgi:hypothetical protein